MSCGALPRCPKCGREGIHLVVPPFGAPTYYTCERPVPELDDPVPAARALPEQGNGE